MTAAVIELNPLADAIGAAAENHDFPARAGLRLTGSLISRIEIRSEAFEFGRTGVHAVEHGVNAEILAALADLEFGRVPGTRDLDIGDAETLGAHEIGAGAVLERTAFEA